MDKVRVPIKNLDHQFDIINWLADLTISGHDFKLIKTVEGFNWKELEVEFQDPNDAMLFLLKWS